MKSLKGSETPDPIKELPMKSYRTTMIASVAAFALAGAGTAVALSGQPVIAGADGTNCLPSTSTSISATGHHATIGTDHTGAAASAGANQGTAGNGTTSSAAGSGGASTTVSGAPSTSPSLITLNTGATGATSAGSPATSGSSTINVNANTDQAGGSGLIKSVLGTVTNATHRGTGNGVIGINGLLGSSGLFSNGLLGGLSINGNVNSSSSANNN
jgi:hypothetical protein